MRKTTFVIFALVIGICLFGCKKKQPAEELTQEPISMESLGAISSTDTAKAVPEAKPETAAPVVQQAEPKLEPLPPAGPYKPTANDIQTALKNAGYYSGSVDGKVGPKTKKAVEEFQKANGLTADGKVGPKTWEALGKYLKTAAVAEAPKKPAGKKR